MPAAFLDRWLPRRPVARVASSTCAAGNRPIFLGALQGPKCQAICDSFIPRRLLTPAKSKAQETAVSAHIHGWLVERLCTGLTSTPLETQRWWNDKSSSGFCACCSI